MIYTVDVRVTLEAESVEQAAEFATDYFQDKDFEVREEEVHEGDLDRENIRQGRVDV